MIRTRDLVLFVIALIFLTLAITSTLAHERRSSIPVSEISFNEAALESGESTYTERTLDRASIIERLRAAISQNTTVSAVPEEPVVTEIEAAEQTPADEPESTGGVTQQMCEFTYDALALARKWPRSNVTIEVTPLWREVAEIIVEEATMPTATTETGSSSETTAAPEPTVTRMPLALLPLTPRLGNIHCLTSEVIGVHLNGTLIFNSDAIAYYTTPSTELIGYARDGFPIYGAYRGVTDSCGGYTAGGSYRYSVSPDRPFILGCYSGEPERFIGE